MDNQLESVEEKIENTGVEPGDTEKILDAETVSDVEEKKEACAEKKSESTEDVLTSVGEASASAEEAAMEKTSTKNVGKKQDGKNKISRKKVAGGVELAAAFILAILSGGLFFNTRGTRLLYISVTTGRVSRYYWVFLAAAVIFLAIGMFTLRPRRREGKEDGKENLLERDGNVSGEN